MASSRPDGAWTRRDLLKGVGAAAIGAIGGTAAHGFLYERHHVSLTRTVLEVSGLADSLSGFRIGFISDLHRSQTVPHELGESAVRVLTAEQPDLVVLGGDYVTWGDRAFVEPAADVLAPLSAPHGVVAVLGNHDDDRDMPAALARRGFTVLRDARTQIRVHGEPFDIAGIRYWTRKPADIAQVLRGASSNLLLAAHTPSRLIEAAALSVPVMLSGHTHGGQIVLPGAGALAARRFPVVAGQGRRENTTIFVSRGVGTVYIPVRVNCPPEVVIVTLKPATE